jgi:transcriptional regulator with XRE-family HTH domain
MRSKIAKSILDDTPEDVRIFVRKYGDLVVRIHRVLKDRGITQKELASRLEKTPSEISKWLSGEHNLTLRSIAKLEAELGVDLIYVPRPDSFHVQSNVKLSATVPVRKPVGKQVKFLPAVPRGDVQIHESQAS